MFHSLPEVHYCLLIDLSIQSKIMVKKRKKKECGQTKYNRHSCHSINQLHPLYHSLSEQTASISHCSVLWWVSASPLSIMWWRQPSGSIVHPPTAASAFVSWEIFGAFNNVCKVFSPCKIMASNKSEGMNCFTFCCRNCSFNRCACFFSELFSCCKFSICNTEKAPHYTVIRWHRDIFYEKVTQIQVPYFPILFYRNLTHNFLQFVAI